MFSDLAVVITTHNRPDAVRRAVRSLLEQTMLPREIVIVDDASTVPVDIEIFSSFPDGVTYQILRNESSKGANFSRNWGLKSCKSQLVSFLDDDDEFCVNKVEMVVNEHKEHQCELITSYARVNFCPSYGHYLVKPPKGVSLVEQLVSNKVGTTSMVTVDREFFLGVGGFSEGMPARQDYEAWIKCLMSGCRASCVSEVLTTINVELEAGSISKSIANNEKGMKLIEGKYADQLSALKPSERKSKKIADERFFCHKYFIGASRFAASRRALRAYTSTGSLSFIALGVVFLLGRRAVAALLRVKGR